jgi:hypothetical protein
MIANGNPKKQLRVGGSIRNTANHSHFGRARTLAVTYVYKQYCLFAPSVCIFISKFGFFFPISGIPVSECFKFLSFHHRNFIYTALMFLGNGGWNWERCRCGQTYDGENAELVHLVANMCIDTLGVARAPVDDERRAIQNNVLARQFCPIGRPLSLYAWKEWMFGVYYIWKVNSLEFREGK